MTGKLSRFVLVLALCLLLSACQNAPAGNQAAIPVADPYGDFTGQVYGIARGFSAFIQVNLGLVDGMIVEVDINKAQGSETGGWWEVPFREAPVLIIAGNSVELDTIAGASETTRGIREAGRAALAQIPTP
jgi:fumarate reductase flavoprotein subunit